MRVYQVTRNNMQNDYASSVSNYATKSIKSENNNGINEISNVCYKPISKAYKPAAVISFSGASRNKNEAIYVGAELPPFWKKGGVATVMNDYEGVHIIPYYNGKIKYDAETGNITNDSTVDVLRLKDKTPVATNLNLDEKTEEEILSNPKNYTKLEEVAHDTMEWGLNDKEDIRLYRVVPKEEDVKKAEAEGKKLYDTYMVYTNGTALMREPYKDVYGGYSFGTKDLPSNAKNWTGDNYAKFNKALVKLLPNVKSDAATVVCSDTQSAYVPYYMEQEYKKGNEFIKDLKPTYVIHNAGLGYTGGTSAQNMFVNLATKEEIEAVKDSPEYVEALKSGNVDKFFKEMMPNALNDLNNPSGLMIPLKLRKDGYVPAVTTVAEDYAKAITNNPITAPEIYNTAQELKKEGKEILGILNPLNDPKLTPYKPLPLPGFGMPQEVKINDTTETIPALESFKEGMSLDEMKQVKNRNKQNLFNRLSGKYTQNKVLTGLDNKKANLIGNISPIWSEKISKGEDVKLFVSWGRGDFQKNLDTVIEAFKKFAKTENGKNSVLILGGELASDNPESINIRQKVESFKTDKDLMGRTCFMDGFAPGTALASAADASVLPSRFAPCELTDLESKKYFCTPIVAGTQGMEQKNFDPRRTSELTKADAYKTEHEYQMGHEKLLTVSEDYKTKFEKLVEKEKGRLAIRGVKPELINDIAQKNVLNSEEAGLLYRVEADKIMTNDVINAMNSVATQTKDIGETIYKNQISLKTGWDNNQNLHPSNETSRQMYKRIHLEADSKAPTTEFVKIPETIMSRVKNVANTITDSIKESVENTTDTAKEAENEVKQKSGKSKYILAGLGLIGVGAGVYNYYKHSQKKDVQQPLNTVA